MMLKTWLLRIGIRLLKKPRFRKWAILEDKKYEITEAVEQAAPNLPEKFYAYISAALPFKIDLSTVYWKAIIVSFVRIHGVTMPETSIPLVSAASESGSEKDPWEYSGRLWYFYSNIIASAYGWSVKEITELDVSDALSYVQEILTERHLKNEFLHGLSEISYPYDKSTKKSTYRPMQRPYWMAGKPKEVKKVKVHKDMIPAGVVEKINDKTQKAKSE